MQDDSVSALDCATGSALALFGYNATRWRSPASIYAVLNDREQWNDTLAGPGITLDLFVGGLKTIDSAIMSARSLRLSFGLARNGTDDQDSISNAAAFGWEQAWLDMIMVRAIVAQLLIYKCTLRVDASATQS